MKLTYPCGWGMAAILSLSALNAAEDSFSKQIPVPATGKIIVDVDFGSIEVVSQAANEVSIEATRSVTLKKAAAETEFLAARPITVIEDGGTITLRSRKSGKLKMPNWTSASKFQAKYTLKVPEAFAAQLATAGGKIEVKDLSGGVKADTSGGSLHFTHVRGGIHADTSGGSIHVKSGEGTLKLDTSGGSIHVDGGSGTLNADTSGGSIEIKKFQGNIKANTSGGGLSFEAVDGELIGSTSGGSIRASLSGAVKETVRLSTTGGGISVRVPADAAFDLDAATTGGSVRSEVPVAIVGKPKSDAIEGPVNGGGKPVKLRTLGGNIRVEKL